MTRAPAPCPLCPILLASAVAAAGCATTTSAPAPDTAPDRAPRAAAPVDAVEAGLVQATIVARGLE